MLTLQQKQYNHAGTVQYLYTYTAFQSGCVCGSLCFTLCPAALPVLVSAHVLPARDFQPIHGANEGQDFPCTYWCRCASVAHNTAGKDDLPMFLPTSTTL